MRHTTIPDSNDARKKNKKAKRIVTALLIIIVLILLSCMFAYRSFMSTLDSELAGASTNEGTGIDWLSSLSPVDNDEVFYMLLLGSDARKKSDISRSDTIMIARVDQANKKVSLISIPRDTQVEIPDHGKQKINAAYAIGGASMSIDAVENETGIPISHCAEIHFNEMKQLVDTIGGVDVDVPVSNDQTGATHAKKIIKVGEQHMDGETALMFARERYGYYDGDLQRAKNQRLLVQAIADKIMSMPIYDLTGTVMSAAKCVTTDLSSDDILSLAVNMKGAEFDSAQMPVTTGMENGVSYDYVDAVRWNELKTRFRNGDALDQDDNNTNTNESNNENGVDKSNKNNGIESANIDTESNVAPVESDDNENIAIPGID